MAKVALFNVKLIVCFSISVLLEIAALERGAAFAWRLFQCC